MVEALQAAVLVVTAAGQVAQRNFLNIPVLV